VFAVPGDGPARAVLAGRDGGRRAVELIDVDRGRVAWRDRTACAAPVVGVTRDAIVCADEHGTRAIGLDGARRWQTPAAFVVLTERHAVVSDAGAAVVIDVASGRELTRIRLPGGAAPDSVVASCGEAGRELYAVGDDGRLARIVDGHGGSAAAAVWTVALGGVLAIDACDATVLVTESGPVGTALVALDRATGKLSGRIDGIGGWWPARDGSAWLEVATPLGIARYPRDLGGPAVQLGGPALRELLASRGDRRLVRATPSSAVLLDAGGVRGHIALGSLGAALGDTALIASSWIGSPGERARRLALPPPRRRAVRLPAMHRGVPLDAELRDLPPVVPLDVAGAVVLADTGMAGVIAHAIDPADGAALYAIAVDRAEQGAVARADLAARRWRWQRVDGCGPGTPVAVAVARDVVVCGARGGAATVRATSHDGQPRWEWTAASLDGVIAGGDVVIVHDAGRATVLDASDGRVRGELASDDGGAVRAAIVSLDGATLVVTAERGRVVARLGAGGLLPLWSIAVGGIVRWLAASGDGVLVALEDGDAYRIDARSARVIALPGLGLAWHAAGDVVTGQTLGGPIPGVAPPPPTPTLTQLLRRPLQILRAEVDVPPPMSTPIAPPPALGDSWQLTLYELGGGLRARNDYALPAPVAPPVPGARGSPLVVVYGPAQREVCVLDPRTGDPLRRVSLPADAVPGGVFATAIDGAPVAGAVLASPLRVVLF
jgi:putative pyrroloquinoline-quinone binding quinoprotein